jgi:8-oxo-dGTP diphosphatase
MLETTLCLLKKDNKVLLAMKKRGFGEGKFNGIGGKIESGETPEEALRREIVEELDIHIGIENLLQRVEWDYPEFHLSMSCFVCHIESGDIFLKEHYDAQWLLKSELDSVNWLPADRQVISSLQS